MPSRLKPHTFLILVACLAVALRFFLFSFLYTASDTEVFLQGDSKEYLSIAENVMLGHGFSKSTTSPYLPDGMRTPALPVLVAGSLAVFDSFIPVILFQLVLSAALVILGFFIARDLTQSDAVARVVALCMALEPFSVFVSVVLLTETLFTLFLLAGVFSLFRFVRGDRGHQWAFLVMASSFFGVATLTKPIAQFLPIILVGVVVYRYWGSPKELILKSTIGALLPFLIVVSPWMIRNHAHFDSYQVSSGGFQNVYSDLGASILAVRDKGSYSEIKARLESDFAKKHNISEREIQGNPQWADSLFREGLDIIISNPLSTGKTVGSLSVTFFTHDLWVYYLQKWDIVKAYEKGFSPMHSLLTEGPVVASKRIIDTAGATVVIPLLGRLFWVIVALGFFGGVFVSLRKGGIHRIAIILSFIFVVYFLTLSLSGGAGMTGRYRYPVNVLIYTFAAWFYLAEMFPRIKEFCLNHIKKISKP